MKTITITGTNNRYKIKKILNPNLQPITKKKYDSIIKQYPNIVDINFQINILNEILNKYNNNNTNVNLEILTPTETLIQNEIKLKIYNYKSQDTVNKFNTDNVISLIDCINLLINSNNNCYYCNEQCFIFYQHIRFPKQWTLDRIDNSTGHHVNNVVISCLQCNLQRKNKNSDKFLQGKQLKLVKIE